MATIYMHPASASSICKSALVQANTGLVAVVYGSVVRLEPPQKPETKPYGWALFRPAKETPCTNT